MSRRVRVGAVLALTRGRARALVDPRADCCCSDGALTWRCGFERWTVKTLQDKPELF